MSQDGTPGEPLLSVIGISKAYKRYPNKWARVREWLSGRICHEQHWVLREIRFELAPGEAVGLIGVNGAGKSTLLKILTGTTQPTAGQVIRRGRIAALLELGMGFHPDFTGRQNTFMAGQLLGMSNAEIDACLPAIEDFAEIGDYFDRPVRLYSSGMQMRLAFSVATAIRPDLLIVDEALSVGDAYFQHKSFARIREFRDRGTTLLIVSHDRQAIQNLCSRALLLQGGFLIKDGDPQSVTDFYNALIAEREQATVVTRRQEDGRIQTISGTAEAQVASIQLLNAAQAPVEWVAVGEWVTLRVVVRVNADLPELVLGYLIRDRLGQSVYGTNTHHLGATLNDVGAGEQLVYSFAFPANLGEGSYSVTVALHRGQTHLAKNYEWRDLALVFNVVNQDQARFAGLVWLPPQLAIERQPAVATPTVEPLPAPRAGQRSR